MENDEKLRKALEICEVKKYESEICDAKVFYFLVNFGDAESALLLYAPYKEYKPLPKGYARIDAFYKTSNYLYKVKKKLTQELLEFSPKTYEGNIKKLFQSSKCGIALKSTLLAIPPFGTRLALDAIILSSRFSEHKANFEGGCGKCDICKSLCPVSAICEGEFRYKECLRYKMNEYKESDADFSLLNGSIMGCDICQKYCPYNKAVGCEDVPEELKEMLYLPNLFELVGKGKKGLLPLEKYLGYNYLRPRWIKFFALYAITSEEEIYLAEKYVKSQEGCLSRAAKLAIERVKFRHNIH